MGPRPELQPTGIHAWTLFEELQSVGGPCRISLGRIVSYGGIVSYGPHAGEREVSEDEKTVEMKHYALTTIPIPSSLAPLRSGM